MRLLRALPIIGLLAASLSSCKDDPGTAIVVGVSNELPTVQQAGTDPATVLGGVRIIVRTGTEVHSNQAFAVDPKATTIPLPGTLTVARDKDSTTAAVTVEVRGVKSVNDANPDSEIILVKRTATLSFVDGKQKLLRMPLQMACVGQLSCKDGETCKAGACATDAVPDGDALPDFSQDKVIPDKSTCFQREDCVDDDHDSFTRDELLAALQELAKITDPADPNYKWRDTLKKIVRETAPDPGHLFTFIRTSDNKCRLPRIGLHHEMSGARPSVVLNDQKPDSVNMGFFWKEDPHRWVVVDRDPQEGWDYVTEPDGSVWVLLDEGACNELERTASRIVGIINYQGDGPRCASKPPTQPECAVVGGGAGGANGASGAGGASGKGGASVGGASGKGGASTGGTSGASAQGGATAAGSGGVSGFGGAMVGGSGGLSAGGAMSQPAPGGAGGN
jgi:hypothetical protein